MQMLTFLLLGLVACGPQQEPESHKPSPSPKTERPDTPSPRSEKGRDGLRRVEVGRDSRGEMRSVLFTVPPGYDRKSGKKYPAVWAFHGGKASSGSQMYPNWQEHFDEPVVFVFPNGQLSDKQQGAWFVNSGDDLRHVEMVRKAYDAIDAEVGLDPDRQYAAGFSSGAHMVWQLACKANDLFDGYAGVAHYLKTSYQRSCKPPTKAPVIVVAGSNDDKSPIGGQKAPDGSVHTIGAENTAAYFAEAEKCAPNPKRDPLPTARKVERKVYTGCKGGKVELVVHEGGHDWPGGPKDKRKDLDLSAYLLEAFELK
jgi:polyhydroxybutyrate depolymerase